MEDVLLVLFFSTMSMFMVINGSIAAKQEISIQFKERMRADKGTSTEEEVCDLDDFPGIELVEEPKMKTKTCDVM